jgi:hypothetical protein
LIQQNTAAQSGGGLYMVHAGAGATATIDHSMFLNNIALEGGGMLSQDVSVKLFDTFVADYAGNPAGLFIQGDMTLQQTTFIGDSERRDGRFFWSITTRSLPVNSASPGRILRCRNRPSAARGL